jgi:hypothetical protein
VESDKGDETYELGPQAVPELLEILGFLADLEEAGRA